MKEHPMTSDPTREALIEHFLEWHPNHDLTQCMEVALSTTPAPLDAAWASVEAALPEGWRLWVLDWDESDDEWRAIAGKRVVTPGLGAPFVAFGTGPTLAAALLALAEKLREYAKP